MLDKVVQVLDSNTTFKRQRLFIMEAFTIYTAEFKGQIVYMVPSKCHPYSRGIGDTIHNSLDEAEKYRALLIRQQESKERMMKELEQKEQKEIEAKRKREDLNGFADDKTPMQKGKIVKALRKKVNYYGKVMDRKALVELKLSEGWRVAKDEFTGKDGLESPCGDFVLEQKVITKTGIQYAMYLQERIRP